MLVLILMMLPLITYLRCYALLVHKLALVHGGQGEMEEKGRPLQINCLV